MFAKNRTYGRSFLWIFRFIIARQYVVSSTIDVLV